MYKIDYDIQYYLISFQDNQLIKGSKKFVNILNDLESKIYKQHIMIEQANELIVDVVYKFEERVLYLIGTYYNVSQLKPHDTITFIHDGVVFKCPLGLLRIHKEVKL